MKITYTLKHPTKFGSEEIFELEVTKPTPKILKRYDLTNLTMTDQIKLLADITGQTAPFIEILDLDDFMGVNNILSDWFRVATDDK
jgi:hypothetical protein